MKERNLAEIGRRAGFAFRELDLLDVDALRRCSPPIPSSCTSPPRPASGRRWPTRWGTRGPTSPAPPRCWRRPARPACPASCSARPPRCTATARRRRSGKMPSRSSRSRPTPPPSGPGSSCSHAVAPIYGFRIASLRFFTVYGPRQRPDLAIHAFTRKMVEGETLTLFGDGTQARDYTYCDDIVAGVLAALSWTATAPVGVETFNLGGNRSVRTVAMVADIAGALGIEPKIEWAPDAAGRRAADRGRSHQVRRGAGLPAEDAVSRGYSALRSMVSGGLWPGRLSACWRGPASGSRSRTTTGRCTCWRRSSSGPRLRRRPPPARRGAVPAGPAGAAARSSPGRWSSIRGTSRR